MLRGLIHFIPWIAYGFVATSDEWRLGAVVGLVAAVALVAFDRRGGKGWDQMVIGLSAVAFFAPLTVYSFVQPGSPLTMYGPALVNVWLALTAWGSLIIRRPFTLGIARGMAPPEVWASPVFYRVNVVITAVWAVSFTIAAAVLADVLVVNPHATALLITVKAASFAVPALFTARYPGIARRRARAAARAGG
ncbi:hypothetical protein [Bailinhaonella thermotolerans]|uniref:DUF3159 domain-containing protein n=1 Tax=Bailinhaonella thermotolerans TaxID=1070861 RepID=A0A3A4AUC8_9ACTN|nr:hypothetical protein [Bailinhaonella thermotolerans]RJL30924.1 hypothetical protein D5H75_21775 [Bailinhaonella thermotolerans]